MPVETFSAQESAYGRALLSSGLIIGANACVDLGLLPTVWSWLAAASAILLAWPELRSR